MPRIDFRKDTRFAEELPDNVTFAVEKAYGGKGKVTCPACGKLLVAATDHGEFDCTNPECTRPDDVMNTLETANRALRRMFPDDDLSPLPF